jgi:hypothetical protein
MSTSPHIVPKQVTGSRTGATSKLKTASAEAAEKLFTEAKTRLLDINNWYRFCGKKGAEFCLTDARGNPLRQTHPETGNLIRIRLPAPSNEKGDGYDWVRIEAWENSKDPAKDEETLGFRVRPVSNPADRSNESAHFYTREATSSFLVKRKGMTVYALERGRNEKPNPTGGLLNKLRNTIVALAAMIGLSVPQWKLLTAALLEPKS